VLFEFLTQVTQCEIGCSHPELKGLILRVCGF